MPIDTITPAIITACRQEAEAFSKQNGDFIGQVILKTDFKDSEAVTYQFPLAMIEMIDDTELSQWCGGSTRVSWTWGFNLYNYEPNAYGDDVTGESEATLAWCDLVRVHFTTRQWLTQGMLDIESKYGYRFTLTGAHKADALKYREGLCMGWRFMLESVAIDDSTDSVQYISGADLKTIVATPPDNS